MPVEVARVTLMNDPHGLLFGLVDFWTRIHYNRPVSAFQSATRVRLSDIIVRLVCVDMLDRCRRCGL